MCFNGNEKSQHLDVHSQPCHRFVQQFVASKLQVKNEKLAAQQRYRKDAEKDLRSHLRMNIGMIYRRKLLGYERNFHERPTRHRKSLRIRRKTVAAREMKLRERRRDASVKKTVPTRKTNDKDTNSVSWDDWNKWSACSVTCGQGRQVRWRHCLSENCDEGLKKAQMKSCRLKDCETKGFLGWLGIKP